MVYIASFRSAMTTETLSHKNKSQTGLEDSKLSQESVLALIGREAKVWRACRNCTEQTWRHARPSMNLEGVTVQ